MSYKTTAVALNNKGNSAFGNTPISNSGRLHVLYTVKDMADICVSYLKKLTGKSILCATDSKVKNEAVYDGDLLTQTPVAPGSLSLVSAGVPTLKDRDRDGILRIDRVVGSILANKDNGVTSASSTRQIVSAGSDFIAAGIVAGDILAVSSGFDVGNYTIVTVETTRLTVDANWPVGGQTLVSFTVYASELNCGSINYFTGKVSLSYPSSPSSASPGQHGTVLGTVAFPVNLDPGDNLLVDIDASGASTATFSAAGAVKSGSSAGFDAAAGETLNIKVDEGETQALVFSSGENSPDAYADSINSLSVGLNTSVLNDATAIAGYLNHLKAKHNLHVIDLAYHDNADTNTVAVADATDLTTSCALANDVKAKLNLHMVSLSEVEEAIVLANDLKAKYEAHRVLTAGGVHDNADAVNSIVAANATNLATAITLANDIKAKLNLHYLVTSEVEEAIALVNALKAKYEAHRVLISGGEHTTADATNVITAADATDLATAITLANDLRTQYEAHRILVGGGPVHGSADATNVLTQPVATDLTTLKALANEIKTVYNLHIVDVSGVPAIHGAADLVNGCATASIGTAAVHLTDDVTHTVTSPDATNLATLKTLANEIKTGYNLHIADTSSHGAADVTNPCSSDSIGTAAIHLADDTISIGSADATNLATLRTLSNELLLKYPQHLGNVTVHIAADTTNLTTYLPQRLNITSDKKGTGSSIRIVSGTGTILSKIGHSVGIVYGTGNVADINSVQFSEAKTIIEAAIADCMASSDSSKLRLSSSSVNVGLASKVQVTGGSARTKFGLDNLLHTGADPGSNIPVQASYVKSTLIKGMSTISQDIVNPPNEEFNIYIAANGGNVKVDVEVNS